MPGWRPSSPPARLPFYRTNMAQNLEGHMGLTGLNYARKGATPMTEIATQDTFAVDELGVRRLVVAGSPVPLGWHMAPGQVESEEKDSRDLRAPVVDPEASKSHAERTGDNTSIAPNAGISYENAARIAGESEDKDETTRNEAAQKAQDESRSALVEPKQGPSIEPVEQPKADVGNTAKRGKRS